MFLLLNLVFSIPRPHRHTHKKKKLPFLSLSASHILLSPSWLLLLMNSYLFFVGNYEHLYEHPLLLCLFVYMPCIISVLSPWFSNTLRQRERLNVILSFSPTESCMSVIVTLKRTSRLPGSWEAHTYITTHTHTHTPSYGQGSFCLPLCADQGFQPPVWPSHRDTLISWDRWGAVLF